MNIKQFVLAVAVVTFGSTFLFNPLVSQAASAQLTWKAPTKNADGTDLTDLAGYIVSWGRTKRNLKRSHDSGAEVSYRIRRLRRGVAYYVAVRAYDTSGNVSRYSRKKLVRLT